jgi:hypothetical protein
MLVEVNPRERVPQPTTRLDSCSIQSPQGPIPIQAPEVPDRSRYRAALSRLSCAENSYALARKTLYTAEKREGVIRCNYGTGVFCKSTGRYYAYNEPVSADFRHRSRTRHWRICQLRVVCGYPGRAEWTHSAQNLGEQAKAGP